MNTSPSTKVELIELINSVINLRANGRNVVGQQLPTLDVTCCVRLHTLLHVVACDVGSCWAKFETGQTFEPTKNFFSSVIAETWRNNVRSVCTALPTLLRARMCITWFTKSYGLHPSHDALRVPTLLWVVASVFLYLYKICPCSRADINGDPDERPKKKYNQTWNDR